MRSKTGSTVTQIAFIINEVILLPFRCNSYAGTYASVFTITNYITMLYDGDQGTSQKAQIIHICMVELGKGNERV